MSGPTARRRLPAPDREASFCPLCHRPLARGEDRAVVPVSPVVWPGVAGLDVHDACLCAARRGAFELPPPHSRLGLYVGIALAVLLPSATVGLRALLPGEGWVLPGVAALLSLPALALLALAAGGWFLGRLDAPGRPGA